MATTPPGWYDDGHGAMRWWDGTQWTEHVATPDPETPGDAEAPTEADIVAAHEAEQAQASELDPAVALGVGTPPAAATPEFPQYSGEQSPYPAEQAPGSPQAPDAYPAGYPGADAAPGAFAAATEPRKSKLWILWVVLGVVLLGIVIAAAIVIPLLFLSLTSGSNSGSQGGTSPQDADQEAAVAAVQLYDDAWQNADCDAYEQSTTEDFRAASQLEDCESFTATATEFSASVEDYVVTITGIETDGDSIVVSTTETYNALFDQEGAPLDEPAPDEVDYDYTVIQVDGDWVIDYLE